MFRELKETPMCTVCVYMTALTYTVAVFFLYMKQNAVYKLDNVHNVPLSYEQYC